jgi:branched-chain amino acid transport system substrate-binding protein
MKFGKRTALKGLLGVTIATSFAIPMAFAQKAPEPLTWSVNLALTGPLAYSGERQAKGFEEFAEWVNANGGIRGRKLNVVIEDAQYKVPVAIANLKRVQSKSTVTFASGDGTPWVRAVSPENNEKQKILMSSGSFASDLVDLEKFPMHFVPGPNYTDQIFMLLEHIKKTHTGSAPARVAFVYSGTEFGRDPIQRSKAQATKLGFNVVLDEETPFTAVDVSPIVVKLREARPDYTIFQGYATSVWPEVIRLSRDYGLKSQFMGTVWAMDRGIILQLGKAADGYIGVSPYAFTSTGAKGESMAAIDAIRRKNDKNYDGYPSIPYLQSWYSGLMAKRAIEITVDAGKPITGPNLAKALQDLKDWDTGGVFGVPVNIRGNRTPVGRIYKYEAARNFEPVPVSDWIVVKD